MLKVAFLWHMHQPYYRDPATGKMSLPWVRLHCLKDYYDLPARLQQFDRLKMTFNLVPSLLEQIDLYVRGETTDRQLELARKSTTELNRTEKTEIFKTFFAANHKTMIEPFPHYLRFYKKLVDCNMDAEMAARTTSPQEIRDLVVWANLVWIDPIFRNREPFKKLFAKRSRFTEEEKLELLDAEMEIMAETIPLYRSLMETGKIEISFTPYFHPILPLICDTESAREALPGITLPRNRFCHPEDAERQVAMAVEMYREKFGGDLEGMWPSEGSVSEQMAPILADHGIRWMASDEEVLRASMAKAGDSMPLSAHAVYKHETVSGPIHILFRDHTLSDRIGFVYSSWGEEKAVDDFLAHLHRLDDLLKTQSVDNVVPIILDGENCWEYYPNDGDAFLNLLLEKLSKDDKIEMVTFNDAVKSLKPIPLKKIRAGSWINHNFRIWIGHPEDNTAWDLLWEARRILTRFKQDHPNYDLQKIAAAEKAILVAEGSDWNWWYGDEHRGPQNDIFDRIYRAHLSDVYVQLGLEIPPTLLSPISQGIPEINLTEPEGTVTPTIDGRITHYYEWLGAGHFEAGKAGGAMHRIDRIISAIHFVSDEDYIYLRTDFCERGFLVDNSTCGMKVKIFSPGQGAFVFSADGLVSAPDWSGNRNEILSGIGEIAEIGLKKSIFFPDGCGEVYFKVGIIEAKQDVEMWPQGDPIRFRFSGEGEEIVWDL